MSQAAPPRPVPLANPIPEVAGSAPALHRLTLPNGLRVLLAPSPDTPVVGVAVHVDVGYRSEPEGRTGFAHLFEHLMFQGSGSVDKLAHGRHVQGSGGVFNGITHQDYTEYFEVLPSAALERALFLEADRLRGPRLTAANLRNQIDVVKEEIQLNVASRPYGGFPWITLPPVLYDTFANAHNGYGDVSELERVTVADAAAFFDSYYAPGNAVLSVAGDLDVDDTVALIERHFGDIPARPVPVRPSFAEPSPGPGRRRTVPDPRAPLPALALGYRLPDPATDLDGYLAHALLGSVLTDGGVARLQRRLVRGEGPGAVPGVRVTKLAAGCGLLGVPLDARDPDTFVVTAVHPAAVDPDRIMAAVDDELGRLAAAGPGDAELAGITARWSAALHRRHDDVLSRLLALGSRELLHGRAELAAEVPARLAAVTPAQVAAAAARLRAHGPAALLVEPSGPAGDRPVRRAPRRGGRAEPATVTGPLPPPAEQPARDANGTRPLPPLAAPRPVAGLDTVEATLPSGLRVVVVARRSAPMVELRLRVPFADPGPAPATGPAHQARATLLASTMRAGTARRSRVELEDELAGTGAEIGVSVDPTRLLVSASGPATGLPTLLDVLSDLLTGASYPGPDVTRERDRLVERIAVTRAQPRTEAREALLRCRFGDHPAGRETPEATAVAAVTAEQVRALHRAAVLPAGSTLVLAGDLDPGRAIDEVAAALAGWDPPGRATELVTPGPATGTGLLLIDRPGSAQSQLRLVAPGVPLRDPRYLPLQLAAQCLGGYFSSRLVENLREAKGYTYHVSSYIEPTATGSSVLIDTDVAREVTAAAVLEIRYELGRLSAVPPTLDEIDAARRFLGGMLSIALDTQSGVATDLAGMAGVGLGADWLRSYPERLAAVTARQVAAAAEEFLGPTAFTGVVLGDAAVVGPRLRALGGVELR